MFAAGFAVVVAFVIFNQSAAHWGANPADTHMFRYFGWLIAQGERPYVDFWDNKPPGIWWLNAAAISLVGPGELSTMAVCGMAVAAAILAFTILSQCAWGAHMRWPALLVGGLLLTHGRYECGANRTETFVIALETFAMAFWLLSRGAKRPLICVALAGACAGAAPLFKQAGIAAGAACLAGFAMNFIANFRSGLRNPPITTQNRRVFHVFACFCGGLLIPPLLAALALWSQGGLGEAYFAVFAFNRAYFAVGDASWMNISGSTRLYWTPAILPLRWPLLIIAAGAFLALYQHLWKQGHADSGRAPVDWQALIIVLMWGGLAYYLSTVGPGRRPYHFSTVLPAIGVLALWPLHVMFTSPKGTQGYLQRPSIAVCLVIYVAGYYELVADSWATAGTAWSEKPSWYAIERRVPAPYERQAAAICAYSDPTDRVYVWGWNPGAYCYACRRPSSRFATLEKGSHVGEHARFIVEGARHDLLRRPPKVLLIGLADLAALREANPPAFMTWVDENYRETETIDGMVLFVHKLDRNADGS